MHYNTQMLKRCNFTGSTMTNKNDKNGENNNSNNKGDLEYGQILK